MDRNGFLPPYSIGSMLIAVFTAITTAPRHNADAAAAEEAGSVRGHLARQVATPGIAAARLARALFPVSGVTWSRDVIASDAFGGAGEINRV